MREPTLSVAVPSIQVLQQRFLSVLPRIERCARTFFRHIRCAFRRTESVAECIALCWKWFIGLYGRGKDPMRFVGRLASWAARWVKCGRGLCGHSTRDVLSKAAQQQHGFTVSPLPISDGFKGTILEEALTDNTATRPDEQATFRLDFPRWRSRFADRDRRLMDDLMIGERTGDVARRFGISAGRVSQKRRQFHRDWHLFHGEVAPHVTQPHSV